MLGVWLHAPCHCGVKLGKRRRRGCIVIRRRHVLAVGFCAFCLLCLLQFGCSASLQGLLVQSRSTGRLKSAGPTPKTPGILIGASFTNPTQDEAAPSRQNQVTTVAPATTVTHTNPTPSTWRQFQIDCQKTQLGPGFPNEIDSAWSDIGILHSGDVLRIEADGFSAKDSPIAVWGWYLNVWSGDGRHWVTKKGNSEPSRLLHLNPRPRGGGYIAINHFLKGSGWGQEKDVPIPQPWKIENADTPFILELELSDKSWLVKLNGDPQPDMAYKREGDFSGSLILQLYDLINPRVALRSQS